MNDLNNIVRQIQANILLCSTTAGTGHPTSSLSAVQIMSCLFFNVMRFDITDPRSVYNDKLIFSKGHASPLYFSLYRACGYITQEQLLTFRKFNSNLEGHPSVTFPFVEALTGSLGQGIGIAVGEAIAVKKLGINSNIYCLLGDSEMAEGSVWESINCAVYNKLNNLVMVVDFNRLGQRGETQLGHNIDSMAKRLESFGCEVFIVQNGNSIDECLNVVRKLNFAVSDKPKVILAKTEKGFGVSFLEDKEGWHGKALSKEECAKALKEIKTKGETDIAKNYSSLGPRKVEERLIEDLTIKIKPKSLKNEIDEQGIINDILQEQIADNNKININDNFNEVVFDNEGIIGLSTRQAFGAQLDKLVSLNSRIISLDAEMSNSTYADIVKKNHKNNFLEMFIAEQNMISVATGLSKYGFIPFVSTFAAFLTRAFDQIRMAQYANCNLNIVGSHCGVSIGADGPSQMAIEDIAMFRTIHNSSILYPCDSYSTTQLVNLMALRNELVAGGVSNINYLRTSRDNYGDIYGHNAVIDNSESENNMAFKIGGSNRLTNWADIAVIAAGVTLHEALKVNKILPITVIDLYSIKPVDIGMLKDVNSKCKQVIVVEDHRIFGGIYESVLSAGVLSIPVHSLSVDNIPKSGTREEVMRYCKIDKDAILELISKIY